jgi:hypothetical protein
MFTTAAIDVVPDRFIVALRRRNVLPYPRTPWRRIRR